MTNIITNKAGQLTVKTSATNLSLNITDEAEFKNLYEGFQRGFAKTAGVHKDAMKKLGDTARENLWNDLGAALAVADVLMADERAEMLFNALEYHSIPVVEDPTKANEFVPVLRLIMGNYPAKPKSWKAGDAEPLFAWSRSVELYAKVLRAAKAEKLTPQSLVNRLRDDKGMTKLRVKDDRRNLASDTAYNESQDRYKAVISDVPKITVPVSAVGIPAKDRPELVALWATFDTDGVTLNIHGVLPTSSASIEAHINRVSEKLYVDIAMRRKDAEIAELKRKVAELPGFPLSDKVTIAGSAETSAQVEAGSES